MRIVHTITKGDVGGAQTHVLELASAQLATGHEVTVVAGTDGPMLERCRVAGVETVVVPRLGVTRSRPWSLGALGELRAELRRLRPDIVHAHSSNAGLLARIASRLDGHVCVYTAHGWPFQRGAAVPQRTMSLVAELIGGRLGDGVICLTDVEARRARRALVVRRGRLWVVPNGLADVVQRRRHADDAAQPPSVLMVARFAPPKRQRELIDTMASLGDLPWILTFVGDGPELAACRRHGDAVLGQRVRFLGHRDDVVDILARHDMLVLWSAYEGMPISLLEGMRAGLCCVASDLPGVRALFGDPPVGALAADRAQLEAVLRRMLGDPAERQALGGRARSRYEAHFSSAAMLASTTRVYAELLARR